MKPEDAELDGSKPLACGLGPTGKLLRRTLMVRSAPASFREQLRFQLVYGALQEGQSANGAAARRSGAKERLWN